MYITTYTHIYIYMYMKAVSLIGLIEVYGTGLISPVIIVISLL